MSKKSIRNRVITLLTCICIGVSLAGCSVDTNEDNFSQELGSLSITSFFDNVSIEDIYGDTYLVVKGLMDKLEEKPEDTYEIEVAEAKNSRTGSRYKLLHLLFNDSYYLISIHGYGYPDYNMIRLSERQKSNVNHDDYDWYVARYSVDDGMKIVSKPIEKDRTVNGEVRSTDENNI